MSPGLDDEARRRAAATKRERTRTALIGAASALFNEQGYEETSMEDIATRAGVSVATAYNYFSRRDQLPSECLSSLLDDLSEGVVHDLNADTDFISAVNRHLHATARVLQRNRRLLIAFMVAYMAHEDADVAEFSDEESMVRAADLHAWNKLTEPLTQLLTMWHHAVDPAFSLDSRTEHEISAFYVKALVLRVIDHPSDLPRETADLIEGQLMAAIKAEEWGAPLPTFIAGRVPARDVH